MDENFFERAEELARAEIEAGIARARRRASTPSGFDGFCDCGNEIPSKRVELGYYRCLECQTKLEKTRRLFGI